MNPPIFVSVSTNPDTPEAPRESIRYDQFVQKLLKPLPENLNACHIGLGLAGELGELCEAGANLVEEYGDFEFYLQAALLHYGLTRSECVTGTSRINDNMFTYKLGQLIDCIKKEYIYNKQRELSKIKDALGYLYYYLSDYYGIVNTTRQKILQQNATKLQIRYAAMQYSDDAAIARADKKAGD